MKNYDLVVIGSGPGGYVAAIRASQRGLKVAVIEKDTRLGGTCLLRGCIPTKSMLHAADLLQEIQHAAEFGIIANNVGFDFAAVQKAKQQAIDKGQSGVVYLMKKNKIDVLHGYGRLQTPHMIELTTTKGKETIQTKFIILATGSVPRHLPQLPNDKNLILTSDEILELQEPPKSLMILGAGAVGVEFASVYQQFGTNVTVVEMQDQLLPIEDSEISVEFARLFKKRGITCHTHTKLEKAVIKNKQVVVTLSTQESGNTKTWEQTVDKLLVAVGRAPVTGDIGCDKLGIDKDSQGYIAVDTYMRSSVANIYAIGDIVRTPWLAHVASAEGILAADHASGNNPQPLNYLQTPSCTYSNPEVASVGLTERAARAAKRDIKVGKFPFSAIAKARISGNTDGFVKIVADSKYDEILGVHIIGPRATDLIAEACMALRLECTTEELANTIHAHPTFAESMLEAAHSTLGHTMHM